MIAVDADARLHVFDLPQIYAEPSGAELLRALERLAIKPRNFSSSPQNTVAVERAGVTQYLTSIISSTLPWLDSDELREAVWEAASARLSERCGRTAMRTMSRVVSITASSGETFTLTLREPSITADNLGMKTWASSYLLSRRLHIILDVAPQLVPSKTTTYTSDRAIRALELGSGTGLVGISFAALYGEFATIHLTDLPEIVPNLTYNVTLNSELLTKSSAMVTTGTLDWSVIPDRPPTSAEQYNVILAADCLYSPKHPKWLVDTVARLLSRGLNSRVVVEVPLREAYLPQIQDFRQRLKELGLAIIMQGEEVGYDDWESVDGQALEVRCWWAVLGWSEKL